MRYMGGKFHTANHILPIILSWRDDGHVSMSAVGSRASERLFKLTPN